MSRAPEDLPDEHVLCYPDELRGAFKPATDPEFKCAKPSSAAPKKVAAND